MSNPLKLQFPQDKFGNLTRLKAEGLKSVSRMYGSDEKYETFLATLKVLAAHAKSRLEQQKAAKALALVSDVPVSEESEDEIVSDEDKTEDKEE